MPSTILNGVRVIDLGRVLAAPLATQILADLGADVLKIEKPGSGDDTRRMGAPFLTTSSGEDISAFFLACNRGKKSVTIDVTKEEGSDLVRKLAVGADIFIENSRAGSLAKFGLDYESLRVVNPALVYCSVSGFGQDGPYATRPGYDAVFQAMSGMMSTNGHADDEPGGGPMRSGVSLGDVLTSYTVVNGVLAALYARDLKGEGGQYLDISLLDCTLAALSHAAQSYLLSGERPLRRGNKGYSAAPTNAFQCADGLIMISAGSDLHFPRLCQVLGREDLAEDRRFCDLRARIENRTQLLELLADAFVGRTRSDWMEAFFAAGVPAGPVNEMDEVFADPQIIHRGMRVAATHTAMGEVDLIANPLRFSHTPIGSYLPPPQLGEHTEQVMRDLLSMNAAGLADLRARGVI